MGREEWGLNSKADRAPVLQPPRRRQIPEFPVLFGGSDIKRGFGCQVLVRLLTALLEPHFDRLVVGGARTRGAFRHVYDHRLHSMSPGGASSEDLWG